MIYFRLKEYSEHDAMRVLYKELQRKLGWNRNNDTYNKVEIINQSQLIPVLKGNSVVIEKFVINHKLIGGDTYRMYIKIGAKAKLPDSVRLKSNTYLTRVGDLSVTFKGGIPPKKDDNNQGGQLSNNNQGGQLSNNNNQINSKFNSYKGKNYSYSSNYSEKLYSGGGKGGGGFTPFSTEFRPYYSIEKTVNKLLGDAILYDKTSRSLVLEFKTVDDAIEALDILPFGLNYKLYLLDA